MTTHEFSIPVTDLDAAGKAYRFPVRAAWLRGAFEGGEATPDGDGELDVRVSKSGNDVVVHGQVKADLVVPCARCLAPAKVHVEQPLSLLMVPGAKTKGEELPEYEFSPEDADVVPYSGDTIVLDDVVRDELLLEIPMIPLCSEDCPGMSPGPGSPEHHADEPKGIDPRLAPLLRLKKISKE